MQTIYTFNVIIEPDEHATCHAHIPSLPGCHTWGDSPEEARQHLREAARLHLESMLETDEKIPVDSITPGSNQSLLIDLTKDEGEPRATHQHLRHPNGRRITMRVTDSDVPEGVLRGIIKDIGLSVEEFSALL